MNRYAQAWKYVCDERGGYELNPGCFLIPASAALVHLDSIVSPVTRRLYTRLRAAFPVPAGPHFLIYREQLFDTFEKLLGAQDVILGHHASFDKHFVVKCADISKAYRTWTAHTAELMFRHFPRGTISSDRTEVIFTQPALIDDRATVAVAVELVAELASADLFGLGALRRLPGAVYDRRSGRVIVAAPTPVSLYPVVIDGCIYTRAVGEYLGSLQLNIEIAADGGFVGALASRAHANPHWLDNLIQYEADGTPWLRWCGGQGRIDDAGRFAGTLPADSAAACTGGGHLGVANGAVSFTWSKIETNRERLWAGVQLVASHSQRHRWGVYR